MSNADSRVRFGDGTPCPFDPDALEQLRDLVIYAGRVGRCFGEVQTIRERATDSADQAVAIQADFQRFLDHASNCMLKFVEPSGLPQVRQRVREAVTMLESSVEKWQTHAASRAEQAKHMWIATAQTLADSMYAELCDYLALAVHRAGSAVVVRKIEGSTYEDRLCIELAPALRVELKAGLHANRPLARIQDLVQQFLLRVGTGPRTRVGTTKHRSIDLSTMWIVEAVLGHEAIDLRLAPKLGRPNGHVLMRLRQDRGNIRAILSAGPRKREESVREDQPKLTALWEALHKQRQSVVSVPASVVRIELDEVAVADVNGYYAVYERVVAQWRPVVRRLSLHSPRPDELSLRVQQPSGSVETRWIRIADLAPHLQAIPESVRERLSPSELLLGRDTTTAESESIELGAILMPDAGGDSEVISLEYIPPEELLDVVEAKPAAPVLELFGPDTRALDDAIDATIDAPSLGAAQAPTHEPRERWTSESHACSTPSS